MWLFSQQPILDTIHHPYVKCGTALFISDLGISWVQGEIWNLPPYMEGKEKPKKEADHSRLVGDSVNKQENLRMRFVLSGCKMSRSSYPHFRILKAFLETLTRLSHVYYPGGLNILLS